MIQSGTSGVAVLNFGAHLAEVREAASLLKKSGVSLTIADARFAKPLDSKMIKDLAINHSVLITIEEGAIGGFGSHVAQFLMENELLDGDLKFRSMFMKDKFIDQASPKEMYQVAGLDSQDIVEKVLDLLGVSVGKFKKKSDKSA